MASNVLDKTHQIDGGERLSVSARKAAEIWETSPSIVTGAIDAKILWVYAIIQDEPDDKPAYGLHIDYVKEISALLPPKKQRKKTGKLFTPSIVDKIQPINAKWKRRFPQDDGSDRFLVQVELRKKRNNP